MAKLLSLGVIFLLLYAIPAHSQEKSKPDSIVVLRIIDFKNGYEKAAFASYYKDTIQNLEPLFFTINTNATEAEFNNGELRLNAWIMGYPDKEKVIKGDKKAVRKFYKETHNKFLDKYVNLATYPDIFLKGEYNCVSASILFGTLLQKLGIPFVVKISPTHVFIIAFPNTTPIVVETTNPLVGTTSFTDNYKADYVRLLRSQKLISEKEYKNTSIDELFYLNFFDCKTTSFSALVGAQYYNRGLTLLSNQKFEEALPCLQKAALFMSSETAAGALTITTLQVIALRKWEADITYSAYKQLVRLPDSLLVPEAIKNEINFLSNNRTHQNKDTLSFVRAYKAMTTSATKEDIKDFLNSSYYSTMGYYYLLNKDPEKAYRYLSDGYLYDTTRKDLLQPICQSLFNSYDKSNPEELFTNYEHAKEKIPLLATNSDFINSFGVVIIKAVRNREMAGEMEKADALLLVFEKQIPPELLRYGNNMIDDAYGPLVKHYYLKKNNRKALQVVKRGMIYNPVSYELGKMKDILEH